jgi:hypothetical protein
LDDLVLVGRDCGVVEIIEQLDQCALKRILFIPCGELVQEG